MYECSFMNQICGNIMIVSEPKPQEKKLPESIRKVKGGKK